MSIINHVLKNCNEKITSIYGNRTFTLNGKKVSDFHKGIDLIDAINKNDYVMAFESGIVTNVRDEIKGFDENKSAGNYVYIKHDDNYLTRYLHLAYGTVMVKVGDKVEKGDLLGYTGATGYVTGSHLHFEIKKDNESINPLPFLEGSATILEKKKEYLGNPVVMDANKSQITINAKDNNLHVRKSPNGNILGYIKNGTYNILNKETKDNYDWYQVESDKWVAFSNKWATLSIPNIIENKVIEEQKEEYKLVYSCEKEDIYAIKLYKGEKLYIKK